MPTCFSALMCHAPIVVPAVGRDRGALCLRTTRAMREVAARAVASAPDCLVLISPHTPRHPVAWGAWTGRHRGDLADFGAPAVTIDLPDAPDVAAAVGAEPVHGTLDHGATVPLAFLWDAGWRGPTAILGLPGRPDPDSEAVGRALAGLPGRVAVIASGDMSHRLKPGAPSGFDPRAQAFDDAFVAGLRADRWSDAVAATPRELAAEDVVDSVRVAMAAVPGPLHAEVLSYEGPWGVGYTEAILFDPKPPPWAVARLGIRAALEGRPWSPPAGGGEAAATFVTLTRGGSLRGCSGSTEPVKADLNGNVAWAAEGAAFRDPRFPPLEEHELDDLAVEVSILEPAEPIAGPESLDPAIWGVIVSAGGRRGLLLPDIDGVDTVQAQIAIARRKGGIGPAEPVTLQRFAVRKSAPPP